MAVIEQADWQDILQVLHQTHEIWSAGLPKDLYQDHIWHRINHTWGRKHLRYMVYRKGLTIVSSLKLYRLTFLSRGKSYQFAGIGALFTQESERGHGYASRLIEHIVDYAVKENLNGVVLFSDIGPTFYESFGFEQFGSTDFSIDLPSAERVNEIGNIFQASEQADDGLTSCADIDGSDIPFLARHHMQWLRAQPFGIARSEQYWSYKLSTEEFLHRNSTLPWPQLWQIALKQDYVNCGYAIIEYGGTTLRILELIATESARLTLLRNIFRMAIKIGASRIRGWESLLNGLEPGFSLRKLVPEEICPGFTAPMRFWKRQWGMPMILPVDANTRSWLTAFPCPILELDHF